MSTAGRPRVLDEDKQATVCSLVAAGVSLRQAAGFVDCDPRSIRREAQRNDDFRRQLAQARSNASMHPLETLRQAAKADWRAALCWMERLDPERFARPNTAIITRREANQFVEHLVESIERAISDPQQRADLFELLSAAIPAAMRRRWNGRALRRNVKQAMRDFDQRQSAEMEQRCKRRRQLYEQITDYLPQELILKLSRNSDWIDMVARAADSGASARRTLPAARPHDNVTIDDDATNCDSSWDVDAPPDDEAHLEDETPAAVYVPPPGRNPHDIAPPPLIIPMPAIDLPPRVEANPTQ